MALPLGTFKFKVIRFLVLAALAEPALLAWTAKAQRIGGSPENAAVGKPPSAAALDPDNLTGDLRRLTAELNQTTDRFRAHLNQEIARFDRGSRVKGNPSQGADADFVGGQADVMQAAVQKLFTARMLAARGGEYDPAPLTDLDLAQELIAEVRAEIEMSDAAVRKLLLVSVKDLNSRNNAQWKLKYLQLRKARAAAEDAAQKALLIMPLDLPESDSQEERKQSAWDWLVNGAPVRGEPQELGSLPVADKPDRAPLLPLRVRRNHRTTVINELGYRIALTDSGMEDQQGLRIFYQEEWVQRGPVVVRMRWRVGLDRKTGQHVLIKRYRLLEAHGNLDELYGRWDPNYVWYLEPTTDSAQPSEPEIQSALSKIADARQGIRDAVLSFKGAVRKEVAKNDERRAKAGEPIPDAEMPPPLRERLFAIRGSLAGVAAILDSASDVRRAVDGSLEASAQLEKLAAWGNRVVREESSSREWENLQRRAAAEMASLHAIRSEALAELPPESPEVTDKFPALREGLVVHVFTSSGAPSNPVRLIQETYQWEFSPVGGGRRVRRTVGVIAVDSKSGNQVRVGGITKYYKAAADETLEEVYDRYGGEDLPLANVSDRL